MSTQINTGDHALQSHLYTADRLIGNRSSSGEARLPRADVHIRPSRILAHDNVRMHVKCSAFRLSGLMPVISYS
jgi:hypothetical protein